MYSYTTFEEERKALRIRGRVLKVLEYDKISERLTELAKTPQGKALASDLCPIADITAVRQTMEDTNEAFTYISKYGELPISSFPDLRRVISYVSAGGVLSMHDLLQVAKFLQSVEGLKKVISGEHTDMNDTNLFNSIRALEEDGKLLGDITFCIINDDEMNDRASDDLYSLRREIKDLAGSIRVLLDRVIRNSGDILQEPVITIRSDRYCVPLKAEFRSRLPGIVHDTSSTGQTIFVEPMNVVEINNRISELKCLEAAEIERILEGLSQKVARDIPLLEADAALVAQIDLVSAKGRLAAEMDAVVPVLRDDGDIRLIKARHPLIEKDRVVPVDIINGGDYRTLVITGPNTGGKTVSLKTCGLLTLMAMAGLMIPAAAGSEVTVFDRVLADIGDEQSIEQSLSTFSAHISNVVFLLRNIRGRSLCLLDELGSGTDPSEGAALAVAILDELYSKGCVTMATTHYKELKAYAITTEGVMNASCEFDTDTLSPTYRLIIGTPGVSNAFVISRKLGLPGRIIDDAVSRLSGEQISFELLIAEAEKNNSEAKRLRDENARLNEELSERAKELQDEKLALKSSKTKILNEMRAEQRELLEEKQEELEQLLREVRKKDRQGRNDETIEEIEKVRRRLRAGVKDLTDDSADDELRNIPMPGTPPERIEAGKTYFVPFLGLTGAAENDAAGGKKVRINCNGKVYNLSSDQLRIPTAAQIKKKEEPSGPKKASTVSELKFAKAKTAGLELMLLGKTVAEAESALDRFIDDSALAGIKTVRIVHGKGTGALRSAVDKFLTSDPRVKDHRLGIQGEGEDGVTIATLK